MSKNIKHSPVKLIGGAIQALGAYDWGGKRKKAIKEAQAEYEEQKAAYRNLETSNIYGDVSNPYANMQNVMEDLTVNQQQAQFEAQQGQQQRANNQRAAAQQAGQLQTMERQGAWKADMTRRAGMEQERQAVKDKTSTLWAMSMGRLDTAKAAHQKAQEEMWKGVGSMFNPFS
jgi:hypothetical protein